MSFKAFSKFLLPLRKNPIKKRTNTQRIHLHTYISQLILIHVKSHQCLVSVSVSYKTLKIYESLGVRKVSKTVERIEEEIGGAVGVMPIDGPINRGLIILILGFLAGWQVYMPLEERQVAVYSVLELQTCKIQPPYELLCRLQQPKSPPAEVKELKLVHWTQTSKQLFIVGSRYDNMKSDPELIASFADELAQRLLPQTKHYAARKNLSLMIQFWFMMDFNEEKVVDMLVRENLQLSAEDCEFVDAAKFSPSIVQCPAPRKRSSME